METYPRPNELPSVEELARLAATIYREGSKLTGYPQTAVHVAGNLWLEAHKLRSQMEKALSSDEPAKVWVVVNNLGAYESILHDQMVQEAYATDLKQLRIGTDDESEALAWIRKNAHSEREKGLKHRGMVEALKKHKCLEEGSDWVMVMDLERFLKERAEERAAQQKRQRSKERVSKRKVGTRKKPVS